MDGKVNWRMNGKAYSWFPSVITFFPALTDKVYIPMRLINSVPFFKAEMDENTCYLSTLLSLKF